MQRSDLTARERATSIVLVAAVHAAILLAVLNASGVSVVPAPDDPPITAFDVIEPPPPPPPVEQTPAPRPREEEGEASPPALKRQATPVQAPEPVVPLPIPTPIPAAQKPAQGSQPTQGAAPVPGPGSGAGGQGNGTGAGGAGSGSGGGGAGGIGAGPRLASRPLSGRRDYPRFLLERWPTGARVLVAIRVQLDGRATDCRVNASSGVPEIDSETCRLVESRLRFRPARDLQGRPVVAWYGYVQQPVNF